MSRAGEVRLFVWEVANEESSLPSQFAMASRFQLMPSGILWLPEPKGFETLRVVGIRVL